mgnify:CR=1 FL=1
MLRRLVDAVVAVSRGSGQEGAAERKRPGAASPGGRNTPSLGGSGEEGQSPEWQLEAVAMVGRWSAAAMVPV